MGQIHKFTITPVYTIKILFVAIIICIITSHAYSKENHDSLIIKLGQAEHDSIKVDILNKIAKEFRVNNFEKALLYNYEAIRIAKKIKYTRGLANSHNILGRYFLYRGDELKALDNFLEAQKLYDLLNDSINMGHTYSFIGKCHIEINGDSSAYNYYNKAYDIFRSLNDTSGQICTLTNKGYINKEIDNDSLALSYFDTAHKLINEYKKTDIGPAYILIYTGDIKYKNSDFMNARKDYVKSLNLFKNRGKKNKDKNKSLDMKASINYKIGKTYFAQNLYDSAIYYTNKTYEISHKISSLCYKKKSSKLLSKCYYKKKDLEIAYSFLKQYSQIKDSILDQKLIDITKEMELKHQYENEKNTQKHELAKKNKQLRIKRLQIYIISLISVIMGLLSWFGISKRNTKLRFFDKKLKKRNKELANLAMYILQKNNLITTVREELIRLRKDFKSEENIKKIDELINALIFKIALSKDIDMFRDHLRAISDQFFSKLNIEFPNLTEREIQLAILLRLNFSSKQISVFMNQTRPSVDVNRVRLRKKLSLNSNENLSAFLNKL